MASCVLCSALSAVYCTADAAFLCLSCDKSIHSANPISRGHKRLPVCALCKRSPSAVYCHEDAAALCAGCDAEVHSANPLPHTVLAVDAAMAQGLVTCPGLPFVVAARHASCNGSASAAAAATAAHCCARASVPAAPEDSACSAHLGGGAPSSSRHSPSDGNTASLAVVPDILAPPQAASAMVPPPSAAVPAGPSSAGAPAVKDGKEGDLELLDFELAWLNGLDTGFDLADLLGAEPAVPNITSTDGMVPAAVPTEQLTPFASAVAQQPAPAVHRDVTDPLDGVMDDFVVPSFLPDTLSDDEDLAAPGGIITGLAAAAADALVGKKRPAVAVYAAPPQPALAPQQQPQALDDAQGHTFEQQAPVAKQARVMTAPQPPMPALTAPPQPPSPPSCTAAPARHMSLRSTASPGHAVPAVPANGANLTREQRVARYLEKRKNRTFQKTIRYASRKAYAEVRPRIKGRFATKEEVEAWKAAQAAGIVGRDEPFRLLV